MNLFIKQKETHRLKGMNLWLPVGNDGGIVREFDMNMFNF